MMVIISADEKNGLIVELVKENNVVTLLGEINSDKTIGIVNDVNEYYGENIIIHYCDEGDLLEVLIDRDRNGIPNGKIYHHEKLDTKRIKAEAEQHDYEKYECLMFLNNHDTFTDNTLPDILNIADEYDLKFLVVLPRKN